MLALIQRVNFARVIVEGDIVGEIDKGILALVAVEKNDGTAQADRLLTRLLGYRVFADSQDKMNLSVSDIQGGLCLVSQFTLAADTPKGMRASFTPAAAPEVGKKLFDYLLTKARQAHPKVASGVFGAYMQIELSNDGPVTFMLHS